MGYHHTSGHYLPWPHQWRGEPQLVDQQRVPVDLRQVMIDLQLLESPALNRVLKEGRSLEPGNHALIRLGKSKLPSPPQQPVSP